MNFERAREIADAVMMEGYALYPYRVSAPKNRYRWTFGVLAPRAWSVAGGCEAWWLEAQLLVAGAPKRIAGRLRCFQLERSPRGASHWDEGVLRSVDFEIPDGHSAVSFAFPGSSGDDPQHRRTVTGQIVIERVKIAAPSPLTKLTIRVENTTPWYELSALRDDVLLGALTATHLLIGQEGGQLLSAIDPPDWARGAAAGCTCVRTHPVLIGPPGSSDVALTAPFILSDHPQIAPESVTDLCDATEIDELLLLRTRTMTDDEKREARATDARTAAILQHADATPPDRLARLHGAARDLVDGEMMPLDSWVGRKVRLRPRANTDAQDALYAGQVATVVDIREDVDGTTFLGVTIDADPAAELHRWYGRCHYYRVDEVEPP